MLLKKHFFDIILINAKRIEDMSIESVRKEFTKYGIKDRIFELDTSSATVELAAKALGCTPKEIAKSLAVLVDETPIIIVVSGDAKIDNAKYKQQFHKKARMLHGDQVKQYTNHEIGGVCPFGLKEGVQVFLDNSLKPLHYVFSACGSSNSCIRLSLKELEKYSNFIAWVEVCR